jgi:hypothetical protein
MDRKEGGGGLGLSESVPQPESAQTQEWPYGEERLEMMDSLMKMCHLERIPNETLVHVHQVGEGEERRVPWRHRARQAGPFRIPSRYRVTRHFRSRSIQLLRTPIAPRNDHDHAMAHIFRRWPLVQVQGKEHRLWHVVVLFTIKA